MNPFKSIRDAFKDASAIITKIPQVAQEFKSDKEVGIARAKFHVIVDDVIDMYGETIVAIAKSVNINALQNLTEDLAILSTKHEEPITNMMKAITEAITPIALTFSENSEKSAENLGKVIKRMAKRNKWDKIQLPSSIARDEAEVKANAEKKTLHDKLKLNKTKQINKIKDNLKSYVSQEEYRLRPESKTTHYATWISKRAEKIYNSAHHN